ncbi:U-BOX DOMAIN-CONTAINING PROTEIN 27-RELATED [Salix purpurea]|uniref:U-box domain-containing protein n=1 Tax=Salix purpurea TaxID=77065 RepID=A0A9Q0V4H6_SALPP|nr:U-BOX DOMAIN-CONTAINING PROTEIN 27-RELATED [Salix purpurea]
MVRDVDLYVTVPSFFRCPISLDVMKSPVSLCTGVTYDRTSIQRWLDSGNNTCPATMQVLNSKEFVPNRTLQRLIKIWADSVQTQNDNRVDSPSSSVVTWEDVEVLVKEMRAQKDKIELLSKFICFAKESEENCDFLAKFDGFVEMLVGFLVGDKDINFLERVVKIFALILDKVGDYKALRMLILKQNNDCLSALIVVLKQGRRASSRVGALKIIEAITLDAESKQLVSQKEGFLLELVRLISLENDPSLIEASLSCLIVISMSKRVKTALINLKVIAELRKLLTGGQKASVSIIEKALKLLEMVTSLREGRAEFCNDTACVEAVMNKVLKVSSVATEHAVMILWSVCYLFRDGDAQDALVKNNGLTKILLLMQSNCSPGVRQMSGDLLKIFRVNSKSSSCLSSYDTKTTHIMPY